MELRTYAFEFVKELGDYVCELSGSDRIWNILFPDQGEKWHHLQVNRYQNTFYITNVNGDSSGLKVESKKTGQLEEIEGNCRCTAFGRRCGAG